jgi:hypothetical protein
MTKISKPEKQEIQPIALNIQHHRREKGFKISNI